MVPGMGAVDVPLQIGSPTPTANNVGPEGTGSGSARRRVLR